MDTLETFTSLLSLLRCKESILWTLLSLAVHYTSVRLRRDIIPASNILGCVLSHVNWEVPTNIDEWSMEQLKSTSAVNQFERNSERCVLTDRQVSCHDENLDVTRHQPQDQADQHVQSDLVDLQSYNYDAHANSERFSPVNPPGPSLNDETITEPSHYDLSEPLAARQNGEELPSKNKTDKVFILHFTEEEDIISQDAILQLASCLRSFNVDITLDLFEKDKFHGNWNMWNEKELKDSKIVLCIITQDFYNGLTTNHVKGNSAYNLMSGGKTPFIPIFLESKVDKNHIPLSMRGANSYHIMLKDIPNQKQTDGWSENFRSLYSFLTPQNRTEPPELGETVAMPHRASVMSEDEKIFSRLKMVTTPVMSLHSHNKMFAQLSSNLTADWEPLGRALGISEANIYAIRRDHTYSVTEQAVKMFQQWLRQNGSRATIQVLATAMHESGPQYWKLLNILCNHAL